MVLVQTVIWRQVGFCDGPEQSLHLRGHRRLRCGRGKLSINRAGNPEGSCRVWWCIRVTGSDSVEACSFRLPRNCDVAPASTASDPAWARVVQRSRAIADLDHFGGFSIFLLTFYTLFFVFIKQL